MRRVRRDAAETSSETDRLLCAGLCLILVAAPLPFGSARPWATDLLAIALSLLVLARFAPWRSDWESERLAPILGAAACLLAAMLWAVAQALPLGVAAHPLWARAADALGTPLAGAISVSPARSWRAMITLSCPASAFLLAYSLGRHELLAMRLVRAIVVAAMVWAAYAAASRLFEFDIVGPLMTEPKDVFSGWSGPFASPAGFGGLLGLGVLSMLALLARDARAPSPRMSDTGALGARFVLGKLMRSVIGVSILAAIVAALLLSRSLGGIGATLAASPAVLFPDRLAAVAQRLGLGRSGAVTILAGTSILLLAFAPAWAAYHVAPEAAADLLHGRPQMAAGAANAFLNRWLLGNGYGAFPDYYPLYAQFPTERGYINAAHNTILEIFADLGLVGGLALIGATLLPFRSAVRGVLARRRATLPALGVAACIYGALHSLVDFPLQLPAVSILFATLLGVACADADKRRASAQKRQATSAAQTEGALAR